MEDDQYLIDQELGRATLDCLDTSWNEAELVIDLTARGVKVSLSPIGTNGVGVPSDDVFLIVGKLVQLHERHATELQTAVYTFRRRPDGKWAFGAEFAYRP